MSDNDMAPHSRTRLRRIWDRVVLVIAMLIAALAAMLLTTAAIEVAINIF